MRSSKAVSAATIRAEAESAKNYARGQITDIYNLVENNDLAPQAFIRLEDRYKESRNRIKAIAEQIANESLPRLQMDDVVCEHEIMLSVTEETKIGNCEELARHALEYFATHSQSSVRAEIFKLGRGDHVFVVIGRKKDSRPGRPATWGPDAYICDPWRNEIFPASEYETKLKNFSAVMLINGGVRFEVEEFNVYKHQLIAKPGLNTDYLKAKRDIQVLRQNFDIHIVKRREILETYLVSLKKTFERLSDTYGQENSKVIALQQKMTEINLNIDKIDKLVTRTKENHVIEDDYFTLKTTFEKTLNKVEELYKNSMSLAESGLLFSYNNEHTLKTRLSMFFNLPSNSQKELEKAVEEARSQYASIPKSLVTI